MPIRLVEVSPQSNEKREVLVSKDEFLIGRGTDCDLQLGGNEVSRHHCMVRTQMGDYFLMDLGSSNGTFLNGLRVRSQASLKSHDELQIGPFRFIVELGDDESVHWGSAEGFTPSDTTCKFTNIKKEIEQARKEGLIDTPDEPAKEQP